MQHDLQNHQQDRLPRILLCLHIGAANGWLCKIFRFDTAETRIILKWLFPPRFLDINRFTSSCPDAVLIAPISVKTKKQQTSNEGGGFLRSGRGQLRETGSTSAAPPATSRSTFPRQHQAKDLSILCQRDIHLIEIKYCEDTQPQN